MARLIDADRLKERLNSNFRLNSNLLIMEKLIDTQPTAYDVDKVMGQLKESAGYFAKAVEIKTAIEIVKRGGIDD